MNLLRIENYYIPTQAIYPDGKELVYRGKHIPTQADVYITIAADDKRVLRISSCIGGDQWPPFIIGNEPLYVMHALSRDPLVVSYRCISCKSPYFVEVRSVICGKCKAGVGQRMKDGALHVWLLRQVKLDADLIGLITWALCEIL